MSVIYDYVKAGKAYPHPKKIRAMEQRLLQQGVQRLILACTELPIAFAQWDTIIPTTDPTEVLAQAAIRYTNYNVK